MSKEFRFGLFSLLFGVVANTAFADAIHFRVLICKPAISDAIKKNLDEAKITMDVFEKTYDRLAASGDLKEISRTSKDDLARGEVFRLAADDSPSGNQWQVVTTGDVSRSDQSISARIGISLNSPKKEEISLPLQLFSSYELPMETWNVLTEIPVGNQRVLWLARVSGEPLKEEKFLNFNVEGRIIGMSGAGAVTVLKKSPEEIAKICDGRSPTEADEVFRFRLSNAAKGSLMKANSDIKPYSNEGIDEKKMLSVEVTGTLSPDHKLLDCSGFAEVATLGDVEATKVNIPIGDTFTLGEWKAIAPVDAADQKATAMLFMRVNGIGNDLEGAKSEEGANDVPEKGNATRNYLVHPSTMRVLAAKFPQSSPTPDPRQLFTDAGMTDGAWRISYDPRESSFLFIGDAEFHKEFVAILGDLLWKD